ncbi:MAG: HD domain-containing protein [Bacillales bacterium]|jgi:3'-5' exoribonuclease|nr:HD domain-containing protein [Bacillales bacterium]
MINDYKEGRTITDNLLVSYVEEAKNINGGAFLKLKFQDVSGTIQGKKWKVEADDNKILSIGKIVEITGEIVSYHGVLEIKVERVKEVQGNIHLADYQKSAPLSKEFMLNYIYEKINTFKNDKLKLLVTTILEDHKNEFSLFPAAVSVHHEYISGLLHHTYSMLKLGYALKELYPILDIDLLASGIICHDIGKTYELSDGLLTTYTTEGSLLGHISIMASLIEKYADKLNIEGEEILLLRHMILAHHGKQEYGSPVTPATLEAEVLYLIDYTDSKINIYSKVLSEINEGEFTNRIAFLDSQRIYKPKK